MTAKNELQEALRALAVNYAAELPAKLNEIESRLRSAVKGTADAATIQLLHRQVHSLNGSAKTFGFPEVSTAARELEHAIAGIKPGVPDKQTAGNLLDLLSALLAAAQSAQKVLPTPVSVSQSRGTASRLIFLAEADTASATELGRQLQSFGYTVRHFPDWAGLEAALATETPGAVIADIRYCAEIAGWRGAGEDGEPPLPLVFLSPEEGLETRLQAARARGDAFFVKPVQIGPLVDRLDTLLNRSNAEPYRILIVEDSEEQARYYATILAEAGMRCSIVSDPGALVETLNDFNPELVLMDMYLPGCTGDELAKVIRQTSAYMSIPIVFLSVERDFDKQLSAMFKGGDEFLTKPILPAQLVLVVTGRVDRYRELRVLMLHDSLTGLVNHSRLQQQLEIEGARAFRQRQPVSMAMIDIDNFKQVNDRYGHQTGDRVLKNLARFLRQRLRASDIVGRYGGEEFAVILSDTTGDTAEQVMNTLRRDFAAIPHETDAAPIMVTFSTGIASLPPQASVRELILAADQALYRAKRSGKNCVVLDTANPAKA